MRRRVKICAPRRKFVFLQRSKFTTKLPPNIEVRSPKIPLADEDFFMLDELPEDVFGGTRGWVPVGPLLLFKASNMGS